MAARLPLALAALALVAVPLSAEQHPNHTQGFQAERLYQLGELDSVALFNGNLTVQIPIGGSYPVGGGFSYGLTLTYTGNVWEYETAQGPSGFDYLMAFPRRSSNAGLGWKLTLGELAEEGGYRTQDGSVHPFSSKLHASAPTQSGVSFSTDGSYLRKRSGEIELPDGTRHLLAANGKPDLILDRFGNSLDIDYVPANIPGFPAIHHWKLTDSHTRVHWVKFKKPPALGGTYTEGVVDRIELAAFNGGTATYVFHYPDPAIDPVATTITRGFTDPGVGCDIGSTTVQVPLLQKISQPDGSAYEFTYDLGPYHQTCTSGGANLINTDSLSGHLTKMTLPTKGAIEWDWNYYVFPQESGRPVPLHVQSPAQPTFLKAYTRAMGVVSRQMLNADGSAHGNAWTYQQGLNTSQQPVREGMTTVTDPLGNKTVHHFSVYACKPEIQPDCPSVNPEPSGWSYQDYGLPFTRNTTDATGTRFLSSEVRQGASTVKRRTYVRYENSGYNYRPGTDINHRVASSRTVYVDDGNRFADVDYSSFDGHGNYRTATTNGNFAAGNVQTTHTEFNPGRSMSSILGSGAPWVLGTFTYQQVTVGTATARTDACFNSVTGALERTSTLKGTSPGAGDLATRYVRDASGNVTEEHYYGGDTGSIPGVLCTFTTSAPKYQIHHTYQKGSLKTSQYLGQTFKTADFDIDDSTGLVKASRDISGPALVTTYEYDAMGRLRWVKPVQDGWTEYVYTNASGTTTPAKVFINRRTNGGGTVLAAEEVHFDPFGRVAVERRKMADGTFSSRTTTYYPQGWLKSRSEWGSVLATTYLNPDPFGRPATIRPPDGSAHDITLTYAGARVVNRTVKVGTGWNGTAVTETSSTTTETYDRQGRLYQVTEPSNADGSPATTTYAYDVGGRLKQVTQTAKGSAGTNVTQNRFFTYDNRGFLIAETHPEKGVSGNGTVSYFSYDARGHATRIVDGASDLTFIYDGAERVTRIRETGTGFTTCQATWVSGPRCLKEFTYGTGNGTGDYRLGKLQVAKRYNYPVLGTTTYTAVVNQTYTYGGKQGRPSARETSVTFNGTTTERFPQTWTWNDLGDVATTGYPQCNFSPCTATVPRTVTSTYKNGFLTAVPGYTGSPSPPTDPITYHVNGQVNQVTRANGVVDTYFKDPQNQLRPNKIDAKNASGTVLWNSGVHAYDGAGNMVKAGNAYFLYDPVSRVKNGRLYLGAGAGGTEVTFAHAYDGFGNLLSLTANSAGRNTPTAPETNRLTGLSGQITYDAAGNLTKWNGNTYQYDRFHQMTRVASGTEIWLYMYDADDERFWAFKEGANPRFDRFVLRDLDGKVLRTYEATNYVWSWSEDHVYRGSTLVASVTPAGTTHLHTDHLGTVRATTNSAGTRTAYHVYYPFGEEATSITQNTQRMKFTGHERDLGNLSSAADDLDYMHARFFNPQTGRFLGTDRFDVLSLQFGEQEDVRRFREYLGTPQSWNRYAYAKNGPLRYVDPDGEEAVSALTSGAWFIGQGGAAAGTSVGGAGITAGAATGGGLFALGVGAGIGYLIRQIPGVDEGAQVVTDKAADFIFAAGQGGRARDFISAKIVNVQQHIMRYPSPSPNDPNDRNLKANVYRALKGQLQSAKDKLGRLKGDQRKQYEDLIRRAEEQLDKWWGAV